MSNIIMQTMTVGENVYEVVDEKARKDISQLSQEIVDLKEQTITTDIAYKHSELPDGEKTVTMYGDGTFGDTGYVCDGEDFVPRNTFNRTFPYNGLTITRDGMTYHATGTTGSSAPSVYFAYKANDINVPIDESLIGKTLNLLSFANKVTGLGNTLRVSVFDTDNKQLTSGSIYVGKTNLATSATIVIPEGTSYILLQFNAAANVDIDLYFQVYVVISENTHAINTNEPTLVNDLSSDLFMFPYQGNVSVKIHLTEYINHMTRNAEGGKVTYLMPETFGAVGDGLTDDTLAVNECIAYAIEHNTPIKGYGKYLTTEPINIIGDYVDLYMHQIEYLGSDNAVVYQGSNSFITIQSIKSKGNGIYIKAETTNVYYNTFTINEIISDKTGVHVYAKKNNYQNKLDFNIIKARGDYSCIFFEKDANPAPGYINEWNIKGGLVTGGLWGIRGFLSVSNRIYIHAEGLGSVGRGGAIFSESGQIPRIYYCRNAEVTQINSFLKVSGTFFKPQMAEICKTTVPLESIDITELELDTDNELRSDNIQMLTGIEVQKEKLSNHLLTKNLIIWGNRFQFPPVRYIRLDVNSDIDMTPQYYNGDIPQCFVAKTNAMINLHPTYAANCLSTFEIIQEESHKLTVKDFVGNVIFDGNQYENGRYRLTAYVTKNEALWYDMRNQLWDIVKLC